MSNVFHLHKPPQRMAHYLRVGYHEHVLADRMRAEGRLSQHGVVFDACYVETQQDLIRDVKNEGHELILDTNIAEQSVLGRFSGTVSDAPWARKDSPLELEDFKPGTNRSVVEPIARFAVARGFHTVLSPTHYLGGDQAFWFDVDRKSCEALRATLDREGGQAVRINYALILDNAQIKDVEFVKKIISGVQGLPIEALWLRVAGFGADATGAGVDKMTRAVLEFHALGIPIIMDRLGGLTAYALNSFGVASGYSNGLKGKDGFQTSGWLKPRGRGGGGNERAVFVAGLDRRMKVSEMKALFAASTTARSVYGCLEPSCCRSIDVMLHEPEAHHLSEQSRIVTDLSQVPEARRADYFLDTYLEGMRSRANRSQRLKKAPEGFLETAEKAATRLNRMKKALEQTAERIGKIAFAPEVTVPMGVVAKHPVSRRRS
ncbi:MAG: hypothetical protein O7E52_03395 [Candidatus Poribacteria bacterium]|nr:hypothetical protein [Candidatus Poribacteria bacterium]